MHEKKTSGRDKKFKFYLSWTLSISIIALICAALFNVSFHPEKNKSYEKNTRERSEYVVGSLGGMRVRIPRYFAENIEYNEGESSNNQSFESRFRSFGVEARYPDMMGLINSETREARRKEPLKNNWIRIAINSGSDYPGDGFLERLAAGTLNNAYSPNFSGHWRYSYGRLEEDLHGLEVWVLVKIDPRTNKPARFSEDTKDIYLYRDKLGKIRAYIECNRTYVTGGVATCNLITDLEPKAKALLKVSFVIHLLPEWLEIMSSSKKLLMSFEVGEIEMKTNNKN